MENWLLLLVGILIVPFAFWIDKRDRKSTYYKEHPEKRKKPFHKRWWVYLIAAVLVVGSIGEITEPPKAHTHRLASDKEMRQEYKKTVRDRINSKLQNLPGQKINHYKATKGENYWTSKDDKKMRLFVYGGKITAIKYITRDDVCSTIDVQNILAKKILHDNNLKYTDKKQNADDAFLKNDEEYNVYSPAHKKWYRVVFEPSGKDMVATFSVYPDKSSDAK